MPDISHGAKLLGKVSAVIVTRGDVDLGPILDSWPEGLFQEVVIWTNGGRVTHRELGAADGGFGTDTAPDLAVYGRYAAISYAIHPLIYVQDDDCTLDVEKLLRIAGEYDLDRQIVANMPVSRWDDYPDSCLVGWGAVFHRDLPARAFSQLGFDGRSSPFIGDDWKNYRYRNGDGVIVELRDTGLMLRECDAVFTTLTPHVKVDVGFQHLPWAEDPARAMHLNPRPDRKVAYELARRIRDTDRRT